MKRAAFLGLAILLFFSLTLMPLVVFVGLQVHKLHIQKEIRKQAEKFASETLLLKLAEYPVLEKGDEIYFLGNKYDIKNVEKQGDFLRVTAINDVLEKKIEAAGEINRNTDQSVVKITFPTDWVSQTAIIRKPVSEFTDLPCCGFFLYTGDYYSKTFIPPEVWC